MNTVFHVYNGIVLRVLLILSCLISCQSIEKNIDEGIELTLLDIFENRMIFRA